VIGAKRFLDAVLEADPARDLLLSAGPLKTVRQEGDDIAFSVALMHRRPRPDMLYFDQEDDEHGVAADRDLYFRLRFYTHGILRLQISRQPRPFQDESVMLDWDPALAVIAPALQEEAGRWLFGGADGAWFALAKGGFAASFSPDGHVELRFQHLDQFLPNLKDALPVLTLDRADGARLTGFALHTPPGENFCGTGERFERPNLFGQQIDLVNFDAAGVNNDRAYKNIPFLLSSRGYGLFVHSPAKMRLDIGKHSNRSLQWIVQDETVDLFVIGGGSVAEVLRNYRRLTGFPPALPAWSYGVWMSRASYYTEAEVSEVARRLRTEGYPADVLHLDVGWFEKEWMCDWQFSRKNFPDPEGFLRRMAAMDFHISLWQFPHLQPSIDLAPIALEKGYVGRETPASKRFWLGYTLDFTNPEATAWYQGLLERLLRMGASAIKSDFGEDIDEGAEYMGMDAQLYHNLFSILYQKAVWEVTERVYGKGNTVEWARSAWAGSQRYPVHWGGDAAVTFDGLASTICGGLHFGLSGFAYWSHDVGGIHGIPKFMETRPPDDVYVRWTQVGVFSSHMRYHGGTPREPYEYPAVADIVRQWLRFRYALLPYILEQAEESRLSGLPVLRSLIIDWTDDPAVWSIADQYLFGSNLLVCPVLNETGMRDVYLPEGRWIDFWSGGVLEGPRHLRDVSMPLARLPLYVRYGSAITFAEPVQSTRQLPDAPRITIRFDEQYPGFDASPLKAWIDL